MTPDDPQRDDLLALLDDLTMTLNDIAARLASLEVRLFSLDGRTDEERDALAQWQREQERRGLR